MLHAKGAFHGRQNQITKEKSAGYAQQDVSGAGSVQRHAAGQRRHLAGAHRRHRPRRRGRPERVHRRGQRVHGRESGYNKEENTIDTQAYTSTILEQSADAGDSYVDETLFLGDSNTTRMYRMFDYCSYDNAIGSVGMTAKSLATFACVQVSTSSGYITVPQAVARNCSRAGSS